MANSRSQAQIHLNQEKLPHSVSRFRHRPTPSFPPPSPSNSWDSSPFSFGGELSPFSTNPLMKFNGNIPFSWEHIPGIPKQHGSAVKESSGHLLPPPPAGPYSKKLQMISTKKLYHDHPAAYKSLQVKREDDPFLAAFMECSKNDDEDDDTSNFGRIWKEKRSKISRTLSHGFGLVNMSYSCKRSSCSISESVVHRRPKSSQTYYYLLNRHHR